ncbi:calcium-binding protein [Sinorhizobium meliloti]|uniref:calcium-binding protein n=1 Tax=Rhizobium meliloti TaxID=382 RepID=UPI0023806B3B|nr:calcium-binding protein [Sinorhizobium meliloti]MDE3816022.1 calcium-binding protein [Sinorhizobium meliloti]MDW9502913.1 hypothetical protein [Sinorhizobium meliloti]MDW9766069.1 hypothetical protein [Sinorhizobium meliloti]MDW9988655.1 hypothetical protein [Sinorhizobium meliloti]MDX0243350.1 hypothetical protein [Sinorhizobium meliloti]
MSRAIYYSINFVTLHQKNPGFTPGNNQGNPYLTVAGVDSVTRQYSLEPGYGDPGEPPHFDTFDFPEFAIGYATFVKPAVYGAMGTFTAEALGGGTRTVSYAIWHTLVVPDDFILPAEFLSPTATAVMHSYLDYARKELINYAKAEGLPFANLASELNSAVGFYSTLETHMTRQFQLIDDALAGRIDANQLMQLSDQAAVDFGISLAGRAAGIPAPLVLAMRSLVGAHIATQNSQEDYAVAHLNSGVGGLFIPPVPTSIREVGSLGNDQLFDHETVNDVVVSGPGDDTVHGDIGSDILVGGSGSDTLEYRAITTDLDASLVRNTVVSTGGNFVDTIAGFENLTGGQGVNRLEGSDSANVLDGHGTTNTLIGLGGDDGLVGSAGLDTLNGGTGSDTAFYYYGIFDPIRFTYRGLVLSLENPAANTGEAQGDVWVSVENLHGSDSHDLIVGDGQANKLFGSRGNDRIFARAGNDALEGGEGADRLDGGTGTDAASYAGSAAGVVASLLRPAINTGDAAGDTFFYVESLIGTKYSDQLFGSAGANALLGGVGNDFLSAYGGSDIIYGGTGIDRMYGGSGADKFLFKSAAESSLAATDTIFDLTFAEGDRIDLSGIDASTISVGNQAFSFIGTGAFRGVAGDLRYVKVSSGTYIVGDVNGDKIADLRIQLDDQISLSSGFFVL